MLILYLDKRMRLPREMCGGKSKGKTAGKGDDDESGNERKRRKRVTTTMRLWYLCIYVLFIDK